MSMLDSITFYYPEGAAPRTKHIQAHEVASQLAANPHSSDGIEARALEYFRTQHEIPARIIIDERVYVLANTGLANGEPYAVYLLLRPARRHG